MQMRRELPAGFHSLGTGMKGRESQGGTSVIRRDYLTCHYRINI